MTETNNTVTVFRRQVIQTGKFEPAEASCSVTIALPEGSSMEDTAKMIAEWGTTLEIANYEALGVGYELNEQGVRMLQKSIPRSDTADPVETSTAGNTTTSYAPKGTGGGGLADLWRDLMNNQSAWYSPNWQDKLNPEKQVNPNGPDYKRKADGKGIWLSKKDGTPLIPDWFVCPFTGKVAKELNDVAGQVRS